MKLKTATEVREGAVERRNQIIAEYDPGALQHIENRLTEEIDAALNRGESYCWARFEWGNLAQAYRVETVLESILTTNGYRDIKFKRVVEYKGGPATHVSFTW